MARRIIKSFKDWCLENNQLYLLDLWDCDLNLLKPEEYGVSSAKKCWFKCPRGIHESEVTTLNNITGDKKYIVKCRKCNSFAQWCLDNNQKELLDHWDSNLNTKDPFEISRTSRNKYWFKCINNIKSHKSEEKLIANLTRQSGSRRCIQCDSFGEWAKNTIGEDFELKYWSEKNTKSPMEYSYRTDKKIWIKCENTYHDDYSISCANYVYGKRCPECGFVARKSKLENKVINYLDELGYNNLREGKCTLKPINPLTGKCLYYDNQIVELNLIIEVNGQQHYYPNYFTKMVAISKGSTIEKEFKDQNYRDEYKKKYALENGYNYLIIPYNADDNNETYKQLIDNKINEIHNYTTP